MGVAMGMDASGGMFDKDVGTTRLDADFGGGGGGTAYQDLGVPLPDHGP